MNTLILRDVHNMNPTTYDELVEMIKVEIVNEKMIDHRNMAVQGLLPSQRQMGIILLCIWLANNGLKLDTPWFPLQDKLWQ